MNPELECFQKAAEFGSPDFIAHQSGVNFLLMQEAPIGIPALEDEGVYAKRINRYASCVCAEFFDDLRAHAVNRLRPTYNRYRMQAREFGRKYGK